MKIAFDGQPLLNANKTGIAYYEDGLVKGMLKYYPENEYQLDVFTFRHKDRIEQLQKEYSHKLVLKKCVWLWDRIFRVFTFLIYIPYACFFSGEREITHFCNYVIPFGVRGKKVVTIHDLAFREYPQTIRTRTMMMLKMNLRKTLKRADAIAVDSAFTKSELVKYYNVQKGKIYVVPCGIDKEKYEKKRSVKPVKEKFGIDGEYFLYLGTLEPRKNIVRLIKAYDEFRKENEKDILPDLVIAGGKGWMYEEIYEMVNKKHLEKWIIFTDYVSEEEKIALMQGALAFCFPSLYEGFGLPPMEAMACGTPVITSCTSSLDEVAGEAALKVNPESVQQIASALTKMHREEDVRQKLIEKGRKQAAKYTWENASDALYKVFENVLGNEV